MLSTYVEYAPGVWSFLLLVRDQHGFYPDGPDSKEALPGEIPDAQAALLALYDYRKVRIQGSSFFFLECPYISDLTENVGGILHRPEGRRHGRRLWVGSRSRSCFRQ